MVPDSTSFYDTVLGEDGQSLLYAQVSTPGPDPHYLTGPSKIRAGPQSPTQMDYLSLPPDLP